MNQKQEKLLSSEPKQAKDKPVLLDAIEITIRRVEDRARLYRNLVVTASVVSILSILLALLLRQWVALVGASARMPSCRHNYGLLEGA
jgi:hypothetical protein